MIEGVATPETPLWIHHWTRAIHEAFAVRSSNSVLKRYGEALPQECESLDDPCRLSSSLFSYFFTNLAYIIISLHCFGYYYVHAPTLYVHLYMYVIPITEEGSQNVCFNNTLTRVIIPTSKYSYIYCEE